VVVVVVLLLVLLVLRCCCCCAAAAAGCEHSRSEEVRVDDAKGLLTEGWRHALELELRQPRQRLPPCGLLRLLMHPEELASVIWGAADKPWVVWSEADKLAGRRILIRGVM